MPHAIRVKTSEGWQDLALTGPAGPAGKPFIFDQLTPSDTWVITHDLNKYPSVTIVDSAGTVVDPDIQYNSPTQVTVLFGSPTSGKAYLN
jgi:hypothetical protein